MQGDVVFCDFSITSKATKNYVGSCQRTEDYNGDGSYFVGSSSEGLQVTRNLHGAVPNSGNKLQL